MTTELHLLAEVGVTGSANVTSTARASRLDDDPLPFAAPGGDNTTHLMSQHKGFLHTILADAAVFEPVQVGTAKTDGSHPNQFLTRTGDGIGFAVQPDVAGTVKPQNVHGRTR